MCLSEKLFKFCFISLILIPKHPRKSTLPIIKLTMAGNDSNEVYGFIINMLTTLGVATALVAAIISYLYAKYVQAAAERVARLDEHKHQQKMQEMQRAGKQDEYEHKSELDRTSKVIDFTNKSFSKVESTTVSEITYAAAILTSATGKSVPKDILDTAASKVPNIDIATFGRALRLSYDQEDGFLANCKPAKIGSPAK